ncbi:MAG: RluA family pseudouridine synthase [Gammaproteobacteria bacterium]
MSVKKLKINRDNEGRRLDNFLLSIYKDIPKTKIYKIIRKGEVRVNSSRVKPHYKLLFEDLIRIPPNLISDKSETKFINKKDLELHLSDILYDDANYLIVNKRHSISVHGGTKNTIGLIDLVRKKFGEHIDLCHRLDKNTTGCLVFAKNKKTVKHFNDALKNHQITKTYTAILKGHLKKDVSINKPIYKDDPKKLKSSTSKIKIIRYLKKCTLAEIEIFTGRTHQIRIHTSSIDHPILFDEKYGDRDFNRIFKLNSYRNIALHSKSIIFKDMNSKLIDVSAKSPLFFNQLIEELK